MNGPGMWALLLGVVFFLLTLDLFVFHRKAHEIRFKEAMLLSIFWIAISLLFCLGLYLYEGPKRALEFLTGYLLEKSLSVDNLFVFIAIFLHFKVEPKYQHKILYWGILGALVMRAVFILTGVAMIHRFEWMTYLFGIFLVYTGFKMAFAGESHNDIDKSMMLRFSRKYLRVSPSHHDGKFFIKEAGKLMATSLFVVLLVVEATDVLFAVDSIPAVIAVSRDPFIVFSSNVFAILGLRALYFALAGVIKMFRFLKYGLSIVLAFIGVKMVLAHHYNIPISAALAVVLGILALSVIISLAIPEPALTENRNQK